MKGMNLARVRASELALSFNRSMDVRTRFPPKHPYLGLNVAESGCIARTVKFGGVLAAYREAAQSFFRQTTGMGWKRRVG